MSGSATSVALHGRLGTEWRVPEPGFVASCVCRKRDRIFHRERFFMPALPIVEECPGPL